MWRRGVWHVRPFCHDFNKIKGTKMSQIYDKPTKEIMIDYFHKLGPNDVFSTRDMIDYFKNNYPKIKESNIVPELFKFSTNSKSRIHYPGHDNGNFDFLFKIDENKYRLYDKTKDPFPIYKDNIKYEEDRAEENGNIQADREFAYERDLQNFLVKNLQMIEPELKLYEEDDISGIEFPAGGGRKIDILAVDKNNDFVVIELKVSKGYDRVIGQLLRYVGWVKKIMATEGQKVRGVIICKKITEDLLLACSEINDINLFEYELSVELKKIK
jgi:hypothetical protein